MKFKIWKSKKPGYGYEPDSIVNSHEEARQCALELLSTGVFSVIWTEA